MISILEARLSQRLKLFEAVAAYYELEKKELLYLEFGVASGSSFSGG
jgi:hypothetical protein